MRRLTFLFFVALWANPFVSTFECTQHAFDLVIVPEATTVAAKAYPANSTFSDPSDIAYPQPATGLPAFCHSLFNVSTSSNSFYRFALWLPEPTQWNNRFLAVGNGGFAGGVNYLAMGEGLRRGFAVISTDTGHNSTSADGSWALNNKNKLVDWGQRAMWGSVLRAKHLTIAYYGSNITYSYYSGCSTGGRQGLKAIQLAPTLFDGVLAGAPAWWTSHLQPWTVRIGKINLPENSTGHIPTSLFPVIGAEVFKQCDGLDGLVDGIITNPQSQCPFDPSPLHCNSSSTNNSSCLSNAQITTLKTIYADYVTPAPNQTYLFPGLSLSSEAQWPVLLGSSAPSTLGTDYIKYFLLNNPSWDWRTFNTHLFDVADNIDPGNATADDFTSLGAFRDRRGKLMMYHGWSDGLIPSQTSTFYWNLTRTFLGNGLEENLNPWYRLYMVPGMQHCAGSVNNAPWYFGGSGQEAGLRGDLSGVKENRTGLNDALEALMHWTEKGEPPQVLIATKFVNDTPSAGVQRSRPICMWPGVSKYIGSGDVNDWGSFGCV